jgi:FkbM family methyltransferase
MRQYYSQSETQQDKWIMEEVYPDNGVGFFVDIGAADGIRLSNTYALELAGWTGICVEPRKDDFLLLQDNRPGSQHVNVCVGKEVDTEAEFVVSDQDKLLSGLKNTLGSYMGQPVTGKVVKRPVYPLQHILTWCDAPHIIEYLSIDTEGNEFDILLSTPFKKYTFKAITVEHNFEEPMRSQVWNLLTHWGYTRVREAKFDDFYLHRELCQ